MASERSHFADPHTLLRTNYNSTAAHICDICRSKLAGLVGYRCNACDFDVHEACADYFQETVSFFAHPWHKLTLSRMPSSCVGWVCDVCKEPCPPGNFVYRCIGCMFDVHPLCTMLPQTIRSPLHPKHDLHMVPSDGWCRACHEDLPIWHYVCGGSCRFRLHIQCVNGASKAGEQGSAGGGQHQNNGSSGQPGTTAGQSNTSSNLVISGSRDGQTSTIVTGAAQPQQGSASSQTTGSSQSVVVRRSRSTRVGKFLLKQAFIMAIDLATGGMASPVLEVLAASMD